MNYEMVRQTAEDFLNAFWILKQNNGQVWLEILKDNPYSYSPRIIQRLRSGELKQTSAPDIVCLAFALELYLKSLHLLLGNRVHRHHRIDELFGELPEQVKASLFQRFLSHFEEVIDKPAFESALREIGNGFVEWRYLYEKGHASFQPRLAVSLALAIADEVASRDLTAAT